MQEKEKELKVGFLLVISVLFVTGTALLPPVAQDTGYHVFCGDGCQGLLPNAKNVFSNLVFILAGLAGLFYVKEKKEDFMWRFFYFAVILVGFGSGYYHWQPDNITLVWDRLPMALAFAALTACVMAERINQAAGKALFWPLQAAALLSVAYWAFTESVGAGDLRPYIIMQYLPLLLAPLIIAMFPHREGNWRYWALFFSYMAAKVFELNDAAIFTATNMQIGGHVLKHLAAGAGLLLFACWPLQSGGGLKTTGKSFVQKNNY